MSSVDIDLSNIPSHESPTTMLHFKILPRKIEVDIERYISSWSDADICSPFTHVKYEEAEGANSNWSNLLPVPCNVIPFMLILKKKKKKHKLKKSKIFYM